MLVLVDIEGMSYEEAASAAGIPVGTVKSRLARAACRCKNHCSWLASCCLLPIRWTCLSPCKEF